LIDEGALSDISPDGKQLHLSIQNGKEDAKILSNDVGGGGGGSSNSSSSSSRVVVVMMMMMMMNDDENKRM